MNKKIFLENRNFMFNKFIFIILIILFSTIFLIINSNISLGLGIAPSREIIEYDDSLRTFSVRIINNDAQNLKIMLSPQGELAEYVEMVDDLIIMDVRSDEPEKEFKFNLKLPNNLEPGVRSLNILATEIHETGSNNLVSSKLSVAYQLKVNVPYSGTFAEGLLYISEGKVNDTIIFTANIMNKGTNKINSALGELVIKGPTNEELYRINANSLSLDVSQSDRFEIGWPANVNPGLYYAEFIINYDGRQLVLRKTFLVGTDSVDVKSITVDSFRLGTIAKLDIDVVNNWNQQIENVYAEIEIIDNSGISVSNVKTISTALSPHSSGRLNAYWDTKDLNSGTYEMNIVVYYNGKTVKKNFRTVVGLDSIAVSSPAVAQVIGSSGSGNSNSLLITVVIILVIINLGWLIYFKFLKKKNDG